MTEQLPDGIYFGLPFKQYAAQDRLSTTAISKLNKGSLVYYEDVIAPTLLPDYDAEAVIEDLTEALAEGRAWHDIALEGEAVFWSRNAHNFVQEEWETHHGVTLLKMKDDYVKACETRGIKEKGTMPVLKARLKDAGADVLFYDEVKANYEASNEGKYLLTEKQIEEIKRAGEIIKQYGLHETHLFGGFPEVSILFTKDGVKYKIRIDYLRPDIQIEYKTIANKFSKVLDEAAAGQIHDHGYLTGAFLYQEGVNVARLMLKDGLENTNFAVGFHGEKDDMPSDEWLESFASGSHQYWFLIQQRGKYNHALLRELPKYDDNRKITSMYRTGHLRVQRATKLYHWYMENNGLNKRWLPPLNPKAFDDSDFKPWQLEE